MDYDTMMERTADYARIAAKCESAMTRPVTCERQAKIWRILASVRMSMMYRLRLAVAPSRFDAAPW